jgi:crotonobetainyl-CoA:carnitine CoA-transferase CaiB-like acyl-CoA transferase
LLAGLGAEVVKLEPPGGEHTRLRVEDKESWALGALAAGKQGVALDLKDPRGQAVFRRLVEAADVVIENFAPGTMERLGLGYAELSSWNPRVVLASVRGFGPSSPHRAARAMDLTIQAMTAVISVTGFPDGPPVKAGVAVADFLSGATLAAGVLAALLQRERTGRGQHVEVAMQDAVVPSLASNLAGFFESGGRLPERTGNRHGGLAICPYNLYETADGYVAILCIRDRHWQALARLMGRDDLAADERYQTMPARAGRMEEIDGLVERFTRGVRTDALVAALVEAGVPCAPVRSLADLVADPSLRKGILPEVTHPTAGPVRVFGSPVRLSASEPVPPAPAPLLGQHTAEVLGRLAGVGPEALAELEAAGVVRTPGSREGRRGSGAAGGGAEDSNREPASSDHGGGATIGERPRGSDERR